MCLKSNEKECIGIPSANYRIWDTFEETIILGFSSESSHDPRGNLTKALSRHGNLKLAPECLEHIILWRPGLHESHDMTIKWPEDTDFVAFTTPASTSETLTVAIEMKSLLYLGKLSKDGNITLDKTLFPSVQHHIVVANEEESKLHLQRITPASVSFHPIRKAIYGSPKFCCWGTRSNPHENRHMAQMHKAKIAPMLVSRGRGSAGNKDSEMSCPTARSLHLARALGNARLVADNVIYEFMDSGRLDESSGCKVSRRMDGHVVTDCLDIEHAKIGHRSVPSTYPDWELPSHLTWIDNDVLVICNPSIALLDVYYFDKDVVLPKEREDAAYRA